jgi:hypothetical protein
MTDGKFQIRPNGAAPLFDADSGRSAAKKRWEAHRKATEQSIIDFARAELELEEGVDLSLEESVALVITTPQFRAALKGKSAAAKLVSQMLDLMAQPEPSQHLLQDNRQLHVNTFRLTKDEAIRYIEDQRASGNERIALMVEAQIYEEDGDGPIEILVPLDDE